MLDLNKQRINIALVANWKYVTPLETTIKSIAAHNSNFTIHLVNPDIPREWFQRTNEFLAPLSSSVNDVKINTDQLKNQHLSQPQINLMSNARLLLPRLLKGLSRVLFMDSDIVVRDSLKPLYQTNLDGYSLAAVQEADGEKFNAGIMVLNLSKIRQNKGIVDELLEYGERPDLDNGDETVLNHFFFQSHKPLPSIYNMQVGLEKPWELALIAGKPHAKERLAHQRELMNDLPHAVIIHYLTSVKPWDTISYSRCRSLWWYYRNLQWSQVVSRDFPPFEQRQTDVLIWSDTDDIPHFEELLQKLPNIQFTLCTNGPVSSYLQNLIRYDNCRLYPAVLDHFLDVFAKECRLYLDINRGQKNYQLLQQLIDRGCAIDSFIESKTDQLEPYFNYHLFADNDVDNFANLIVEQVAN